MKIAVVGMGLIGGSFCRTVKRKTDYECYGMDKNTEVCDMALKDGSVDGIVSENELKDMDIVMVCLHPQATIDFIKSNAENFNKNGIVADVCGIKGVVVNEVSDLLSENGVRFVGCHPMAGREFSGYSYSVPTLFDNASFIITHNSNTDKQAIADIEKLAKKLGFGNVVITTPENHDKVIAFTSQLAHVVSNAYVKSPEIEKYSGYSAGSFQDLTRVAKLDENMWSDLFLMNRDALLFEVNNIIEHLCEYRDALESSDKDGLRELLKQGRILKEKSLELK